MAINRFIASVLCYDLREYVYSECIHFPALANLYIKRCPQSVVTRIFKDCSTPCRYLKGTEALMCSNNFAILFVAGIIKTCGVVLLL